MITNLKEKEKFDASSDGIVAELRALVAEWDADPTMQENAEDTEEAASTVLAAEKGRTASANRATIASAVEILSIEKAKKEATNIIAAAMVTALAAEHSRKEAMFEEGVAEATTTSATLVAAPTTTEKKEAKVQMATAHAVF